MTILEQLAAYAHIRVKEAKQRRPLAEIKLQAMETEKGDFAFEKALKGQDLSFICECKKASPSRGLIAPDYPYLKIAREYEEAGADCISLVCEKTSLWMNI